MDYQDYDADYEQVAVASHEKSAKVTMLQTTLLLLRVARTTSRRTRCWFDRPTKEALFGITSRSPVKRMALLSAISATNR